MENGPIPTKNEAGRWSISPVAVAAAIAASGLFTLLLVDHGPWNRPRLQNPEVILQPSTAAAAQAVGATVTPTERKLDIEPTPPGPKPSQPAVPN